MIGDSDPDVKLAATNAVKVLLTTNNNNSS
jgi:hypothetical protein